MVHHDQKWEAPYTPETLIRGTGKFTKYEWQVPLVFINVPGSTGTSYYETTFFSTAISSQIVDNEDEAKNKATQSII